MRLSNSWSTTNRLRDDDVGDANAGGNDGRLTTILSLWNLSHNNNERFIDT